MRIRLFSEVALFKYNVSTILSPIVGFINGELRPKSPLLPRPQSGPLIALVRSSVTDKQTGRMPMSKNVYSDASKDSPVVRVPTNTHGLVLIKKLFLISIQIRDAVALCEYFSWLEQEVPKDELTEITGAAKLEELRR